MTDSLPAPGPTRALPPTLEEIEEMALVARDTLPGEILKHARKVSIRVEDLADDQMLAYLNIDDPFELTGLYDGIPLTEKSVMDQPMGPDVIWLFRRAILDEWVARGTEEIGTLVAHVLVHEFAHHFGWSDGDIASIDRWWE
ncbi:MAG TPA: neutral zinc metallopeptidase [Maritimibacter sp.]|nr:neutral zinc metallopeptidase [Maritimibacter sp.]